jgi:aspartate-semialdehyde dehydrogenase
MYMKLVGLVGWRGMVGSVLLQRMQEENDFAHLEPVFFSTSNAGGKAPAMAKNETALKDANDIDALKVAITPATFSLSCVRLAGMVTG